MSSLCEFTTDHKTITAKIMDITSDRKFKVFYETSGEVIEVDQNVFRLKSGEGKHDCALKNKVPENLTVGTVIRIFGFSKIVILCQWPKLV